MKDVEVLGLLEHDFSSDINWLSLSFELDDLFDFELVFVRFHSLY